MGQAHTKAGDCVAEFAARPSKSILALRAGVVVVLHPEDGRLSITGASGDLVLWFR